MKSLAILALASLGQASPLHARSLPIEALLEQGPLDVASVLSGLGAAGGSPSSDNWIFSEGTQYRTRRGPERWGNNEFQYYTASPENSVLTGEGTIKIMPRKAPAPLRNSTVWYTSARLESQRADFIE